MNKKLNLLNLNNQNKNIKKILKIMIPKKYKNLIKKLRNYLIVKAQLLKKDVHKVNLNICLKTFFE